jgi:hypothetical protein
VRGGEPRLSLSRSTSSSAPPATTPTAGTGRAGTRRGGGPNCALCRGVGLATPGEGVDAEGDGELGQRAVGEVTACVWVRGGVARTGCMPRAWYGGEAAGQGGYSSCERVNWANWLPETSPPQEDPPSETREGVGGGAAEGGGVCTGDAGLAGPAWGDWVETRTERACTDCVLACTGATGAQWLVGEGVR